MNRLKLPTQGFLKTYFDYDGTNLIYKEKLSKNTIVGARAGNYDKYGYLNIGINYKRYKAHRLIWVYFYGDDTGIDEYDIDHINGIEDDNSIENLRLVTHQENHFNETKAKGFCYIKERKKYLAHITIDGKFKNLGYYKTQEEARGKYLEAKKKYHLIGQNNV